MPKVILVANTEWYLYNFRLSLARYLRERGFEVILASPPGRFALRLEEAGFRWIAWEVGRQTLAPWKELGAILDLVRIYHREAPDLVHHHTIKPVLYGALASRIAGLRGSVNSITGRGYVFLGERFQVRLLRFLVKGLYRLAFQPANTVAIFENITDQTFFIDNDLISPERTYLIESVGVDPDRFYPEPEPEGTPVILQASRMLWDKGIGELVEAARLLKKRVEVRVALAGTPDPGNPASIPESTLQSWHDEGIVEWWGFQADMQKTYRQCHIVVLPSKYAEGVPTVLLEAAACGRPVVTTEMPGCKDFVTHGYNGFIVPVDNPPALAGALERLVEDPELRTQMGNHGRSLVLERFTTEKVNTATLDVYNQLLGK